MLNRMQRQVIFDADDSTGYCFDVERALEEGLVEEMTVTIVHPVIGDLPVRLTDEVFDALLTATDLSVNMPPGEPQTITLRIQYQYDYKLDAIPAPAA